MTVYQNQELVNKNFDNKNLKNSTFTNVTLTNCSFKNTNLKNCVFTSTNLKNSTFMNNNLTNLKSSNISAKEISQIGYDIDGEANGDDSGEVVSISDNGLRIAVGSKWNAGINGNQRGHVRVYEWTQFTESMVGLYHYSSTVQDDTQTLPLIITNNTDPVIGDSYWTQVGYDIDGEGNIDRSAYGVSLSSDGNRLAIGARYNDGIPASDTGHVRVYEWIQFTESMVGLYHYSSQVQNTSQTLSLIITNNIEPTVGNYYWTQVGKDIDGDKERERIGISVSLSSDGTRVAVGSIDADETFGDYDDNTGLVRVFEWDGSSWNQLGNDMKGEARSDLSGWSVSLSGNGTRVAIGAKYNDGTTGNIDDNRGHVRVYEWDGSSWNQLGDDFDGKEQGDQAGGSVSLNEDGSRLAFGAIYYDDDGIWKGMVRVFDWNGSVWTQVGNDFIGDRTGDFKGRSVSLSSDGSRLLISSTGDDGTSTEDVNFNRGSTSLYEWINGDWVEIGERVLGSDRKNELGNSASISGDGKSFITGAPYPDTTPGYVRVFDCDILYSNNFSIDGGYIVGSGVNLSNLQLENVNFNQSNLSNVNFSNTTFKNVQFTKNDFTNTIFSKNTFEDCTMMNPKNLTSLSLPLPGISEVVVMNTENSGKSYSIYTNISIYDDGYSENYSENTLYFNNFENNKLIQMSGTIKTVSNSSDVIGIFKGIYDNITYSSNKFLSNETDIPSDDHIYVGSGEYTLTETYLTGSFTIAFNASLYGSSDGYDINVKTSFDIGNDPTSFFNSLNLTSNVLISSDLLNDPFITNSDTEVVFSSITPSYTPTTEDSVFVVLDTDGSSITFNLPEENTIKIVRDSSTQYSVFKNEETTAFLTQTTGDIGSEEDFEWKIGSVLAQLNAPFGVICFGADEIVETDQGYVPIQQIDTKTHTIRDLPVEQRSHIRCMDEKVVLIEKDALGKNYPNKDTIVSLNHQILLDNKYIRARSIQKNGVSLIDSNNRELYNVMLPEYTHMRVNNLVVETLNPIRHLK
jgi:hypothetical protein